MMKKNKIFLMASSPLATTTRRTSCRAITVAAVIGWLAFFVPIQITQKLLFTQQQHQQHQQQPAGAVIKNNDERSADNNINNDDDDGYEYAPIIVGAGMGTTGTHLMFDATCAMNIASVHYRLNCHLLHADNNNTAAATTTTTAAIATNNTHYYQKADYKTLLEHHLQLTRMMLTMQDMTSSPAATAANNNNNNFMTPLQFKQKVLHHLEEIIAWVYHHKQDNNDEGDGGITLALHDAPYPLLISSILKLVQKYFGIKTKPIILLSERNSNEWIVRRTKLHWRHTYVCRESVVLNDSRMSHANMRSSSRSLEGGAFDILGCIDKAQRQLQQHEQQQQQQQLTRDDIVYNLKEVQRLNHTQYVVDSMNDYQNAIRDLAVFNYNMFERSSNNNRTSVEDLVQMIKNAMLEKRITWLLQ